jgi:replicative DNA helicase
MSNAGSDAAFEKGLPANLEAERGILGTCQSGDADELEYVMNHVAESDFSIEKHRRIWMACRKLHESGQPVERVTLANALKAAKQLESVDGLAYLSELDALPSGGGILESYCRILRVNAIRRMAVFEAERLRELAMTEGGAEDIVSALQRATEAISGIQADDSDGMLTVAEVFERDFNGDFLKFVGEKQQAPTIPLPWDDPMGGLRVGEMTIIGGRPGDGKSIAAAQIASWAARAGHRTHFWSLEMDSGSILRRVIAAEAPVSHSRLRSGDLDQAEKREVFRVLGDAMQCQIWLRDDPNASVERIRRNLRKAKAQGLAPSLAVIDYLQLLTGSTRAENRVNEIGQISRGLKKLAMEFKVALVVLAQISREAEKQGREPRLSDLRESGCLAGDTRVLMADGGWCRIDSLVGLTPDVVAEDGNRKAIISSVSKVWKTGDRQTFTVRTSTGRRIRATSNHPFRTLDGYVRLEDLNIGSRIAVLRMFENTGECLPISESHLILLAHLIGDGSMLPRACPRYSSEVEVNLKAVTQAAKTAFGITAKRTVGIGRQCFVLALSSGASKWHPNVLTEWLKSIDVFGKRSHEKHFPEFVFRMSTEQQRLLLRHLWSTDGCMGHNEKMAFIGYSTTSFRLAVEVQELLMRAGVISRINTMKKAGYRDSYGVVVSGAGPQIEFLRNVGVFGCDEEVAQIKEFLEGRKQNTNTDTIPREVWPKVWEEMRIQGIPHRTMAAMIGAKPNGASAWKFCPSRKHLKRYADALQSQSLTKICESDMYWDEIVEITPGDVEPVFDMEVNGTHNFVANGIFVHNSIEQDADNVVFVHRVDMEDKSPIVRSLWIVRKQRNGPTGTVDLTMHKDEVRFVGRKDGI